MHLCIQPEAFGLTKGEKFGPPPPVKPEPEVGPATPSLLGLAGKLLRRGGWNQSCLSCLSPPLRGPRRPVPAGGLRAPPRTARPPHHHPAGCCPACLRRRARPANSSKLTTCCPVPQERTCT